MLIADRLTADTVAVTVTVTALILAPSAIAFTGEVFYLDLLTRVLILAIAVLSLKLIVGGGMISLGHAAYLGIGAYSVGIPAYYELHNGFFHLALAAFGGATFAFITGAICLRTKGLYFILITLAFAQMLYFILLSMDEYGADDGLVIYQRSEMGVVDLENPTVLYYAALVMLLTFLYCVRRLTAARFGNVIFAARHNDERMQALGFDTYRYKLLCYVLSGLMCGVAGFFLGNFTNFISPEMMDWTRSADLLFMLVIGTVIAGAFGDRLKLFGALFGAALFILLENFLSDITVYWHLIFGALLIALVLFTKRR